MKSLSLILISTLFFTCLPAQAGGWLWVDKPEADNQESIGNSQVRGLATSKEGITYSTGYFTQKMTIQGIVLQAASPELHDAFVAKYDTNGNVIWAFSMPASDHGYGNSIALDNEQEHFYVVGTFSGQIQFDAATIVQSPKDDTFFIAKYDTDGKFLWAQTGGSLNPAQIIVDGDGNVLVTGSFKGEEDLGGVLLQSQGNFDVFMAKYQSSGQLMWAQSAGTIGNDGGSGVAADSSGNIYITGAMAKGMAHFGPKLVDNTNGNWRSVFVAKYKFDGSLLWARIESSAMPSDSKVSAGYGIACDQFGNCYVTGSFNFDLQFTIIVLGGGAFKVELKGKADKDIFLIKYASSGLVKWVQSAGGSTSAVNGEPLLVDDEGLAIALSRDGSRVFITGYFESDCSFSGQSLNNTGDKDIFVASYSSDWGQLKALEAVGANDFYSAAAGYAISTDADGSTYVGGRFNTNPQASAFFKPFALTSNEGLYDAYVGKWVTLELIPRQPRGEVPGR